MEVEGILLNLTTNFCFIKNLKAQILEICLQKKFRVIIVLLNLQEDNPQVGHVIFPAARSLREVSSEWMTWRCLKS